MNSNKLIGFLPSVPSFNVASARLRCYLLCTLLKKQGFNTKVVSRHSTVPDLLVVQKRYDLNSLTLMRKVKANGGKVIFDICDNRLVSETDAGIERLIEAFKIADHVIFSSDYLKNVFQQKNFLFKKEFTVIPDFIENYARYNSVWDYISSVNLAALLHCFFDLFHLKKFILWFGNTPETNGGGAFDLLKYKDELKKLPTNIVVVSNLSNHQKMILRHSGLNLVFREWNYVSLKYYLVRSQGIVLPILQNDFSMAKTNNRLLTCLYFGKKVFYDEIPSYSEVKEAQSCSLPELIDGAKKKVAPVLSKYDDSFVLNMWIEVIKRVVND